MTESPTVEEYHVLVRRCVKAIKAAQDPTFTDIASLVADLAGRPTDSMDDMTAVGLAASVDATLAGYSIRLDARVAAILAIYGIDPPL